jgi:hypothetical protein
MAAVAKGLIHGASATAQADSGATAQAEGFALGVDQFEIAFDAQVSVIVYGDFCAHHYAPEILSKSYDQTAINRVINT